MTSRLPILAAVLAALAGMMAPPAAAQTVVTVIEEEWIDGEWVVVRHDVSADVTAEAAPSAAQPPASRLIETSAQTVEANAIAAYGPFRVLDARTAAIVDITDGASPSEFAAMLAAYPEIATLEFVEAPGTHDDRANLLLGRMIRARGIATRVPAGGSVRSGGVELFLGGISWEIHVDSEFAVHGWLDDRGLGAEDYPMSAPEHRRYLDYYMEMGFSESGARDFYAMTNSVPFEDALWLTGADMQGWIGAHDASEGVTLSAGGPGPQVVGVAVAPRLAYLDLDPAIQ